MSDPVDVVLVSVGGWQDQPGVVITFRTADGLRRYRLKPNCAELLANTLPPAILRHLKRFGAEGEAADYYARTKTQSEIFDEMPSSAGSPDDGHVLVPVEIASAAEAGEK